MLEKLKVFSKSVLSAILCVLLVILFLVFSYKFVGWIIFAWLIFLAFVFGFEVTGRVSNIYIRALMIILLMSIVGYWAYGKYLLE